MGFFFSAPDDPSSILQLASSNPFGINFGQLDSSQDSTQNQETKSPTWNVIANGGCSKRRLATNIDSSTNSPNSFSRTTVAPPLCKVAKLDSQSIDEG